MTIAGLWERLVKHGCSGERVPLRIYAERFFAAHHRPLRVGIDSYMWLFELIPRGITDLGALTPEILSKLVLNFHSRIRELIKLNISFVFVFDGNYKVQKRRWETHSNSTQSCGYAFAPSRDTFEESYDLVNTLIKDRPYDCGTVDLAAVAKIKELLEDWNITWVQAPAEAEAELGRLNACRVIDAIISNDGDGLMFGAKTILRNCSKWVPDAPSGWTPHDNSLRQQNEFYITPFEMATITTKTGLTRERIIFIACLSGNDFSGGAAGLGIIRAFHLAQVGTPQCPANKSKKDFVSLLVPIFVSNVDSRYIRGKPPFSPGQRQAKLVKFASKLTNELKTKSKEYFGRAYNSDTPVDLPPDFYFMMHFYPLLSPLVYCFAPYSTNNAQLSDDDDSFAMCHIPQPAALLNNSNMYSFIRGSNKGKVGISNGYRIGQKVKSDHDLIDFIATFSSLPSISWFETPNFTKMCEYRLPINKDTRSFLVKNLSEAYIFRSIECGMGKSAVEKRNMFINSSKSLKLPVKHKSDTKENGFRYLWSTEVYQVKYNDEDIFASYLTQVSKDDIYDENFNKKSKDDSNSYVWIQKYLLESVPEGRAMIQEYNDRLEEKKKLYKKGSPRKRNRRMPKQSSTLVNIKHSPIKITPKKDLQPIKEHGDQVKAPQFTPSRPNSKEANAKTLSEMKGKTLIKGQFWLDEKENHRKRTLDAQSPAKPKHTRQTDLTQWFQKRREPMITKKSSLPHTRSRGEELAKEFHSLVPPNPEDHVIVIDESSDSELSPVHIGDEPDENPTKEAKAQNNVPSDVSSSFLEESDSSLLNAEDDIKNLLGL